MFRYLKKRISARDKRFRSYAFSDGSMLYFCDWLEQVGNGYGNG